MEFEFFEGQAMDGESGGELTPGCVRNLTAKDALKALVRDALCVCVFLRACVCVCLFTRLPACQHAWLAGDASV